MKKVLLIGLAATAMLASCSNDETVEMAQQKAIGFSNAFVNNGTRSVNDPSYTKTNLPDFAVYGFTQTGQIFDREKVSQTINNGVGQNDWTYEPIQYWVPGNTYTFGAIAPYSATENSTVTGVTLSNNDTKVGMTVKFTNTDENQVDLLHAAPTQIAAANVTATYDTPVSMTFNHQLSKVKFTFNNSVGEGYKVKVQNVKITNAKQTGTLTIEQGKDNVWNNQDGTLILNFGDVKTDTEGSDVIAYENEMESYNEKLMIPTPNTEEYTVTFNVLLYMGDVLLNPESKPYSHTTTIKNTELKLGYCYDFKATLTSENVVDPDNKLQPIKFEVSEVSGWEEQDATLNVPTTSTDETE